MQIQKIRKTSLKNRSGFIILVFFSCLHANFLFGQTKTIYPRKITVASGFQSTIDEPSEIIKPSDFSPGKKYPLLIFLPFTGGDAKNYFELYSEDLSKYGSFIVLLPAQPSSEEDHSWQGFEASTFRYENKILEDLKNLYKEEIVDTTKVILVGYSMGGDMSWAIAQRHPELFKGAIISGSRTSWSEKNGIAQIKKYGLKYFFVMGTEESEIRLKMLKANLNILDKNQILYKFEQCPGDHVPAPVDLFVSGLNFILD